MGKRVVRLNDPKKEKFKNKKPTLYIIVKLLNIKDESKMRKNFYRGKIRFLRKT